MFYTLKQGDVELDRQNDLGEAKKKAQELANKSHANVQVVPSLGLTAFEVSPAVEPVAPPVAPEA